MIDADLSHPPEKIPELAAAMEDPNVDFVIGSRYVCGGTTADDWGIFRLLNSKLATLLAWPLTSVRDPMAGFFCLRKEIFESAAASLDPVGYKIGLELLVKCGCKRVVEVPISFSPRLFGTSKLNLREQWKYLQHLKRLYDWRFRNWAYFVQFVTVGLSGLVVDLFVFSVLLRWLELPVARALSIWTAMTWNFVLNRNLTFSYAREQSIGRQYLGFCASCLTGAILNLSTSVALSSLSSFFAANNLLAAVSGIAVGMVSNFLLCRTIVFQRHGRRERRSETLSSDSAVRKDDLRDKQEAASSTTVP